ncbi:DUF1501 domain-containing protein [Spirosoma sp. KUDC1026]|uniref:DUF1501 domain-containing protein n=1 Tax=Spirosoma sp. KUDC1026 TaxID=2745947 RepID=UPI00159BA3B9|nr:DUF1501 domain-containing protein [Spirosoma sp. KUDC1026]QKZ12559.1 DUF1501 domain-containing protein [Spirosoma sp. KUDC1026]
MKRRDFLQQSGLTVAGTMLIPNFLKAFEINQLATPVATGKTLVIVQLSGGNDGLNTVVPFRNDVYYRERPTLAIPGEKVLKLNDEIGFNPALESLKKLYDDGLVTVVNNVGYPNPDRSHFRSMDIWQTASRSDQYLSTGWLGRYLDASCSGSGCLPHQAIEVDDTLSLAMKGDQVNGLAMLDPKKLYNQTQNSFVHGLAKLDADHAAESDNLHYLYKTLAETNSSAAYVYNKAGKVNRTQGTYPATELGNRLKTVSELIQSGVATSVYYISISGFDTHINQPGQQERLLRQYADAVKAFMGDMKAADREKDVLLMTFSEFGRRVKQNASNGTDHGTANNIFLVGGNLRPGSVFNEAPNLIDLDEGDLKYTVDFRTIYASLLRNWLKADDVAILGQKFDTLNFV